MYNGATFFLKYEISGHNKVESPKKTQRKFFSESNEAFQKSKLRYFEEFWEDLLFFELFDFLFFSLIMLKASLKRGKAAHYTYII